MSDIESIDILETQLKTCFGLLSCIFYRASWTQEETLLVETVLGRLAPFVEHNRHEAMALILTSDLHDTATEVIRFETRFKNDTANSIRSAYEFAKQTVNGEHSLYDPILINETMILISKAVGTPNPFNYMLNCDVESLIDAVVYYQQQESIGRIMASPDPTTHKTGVIHLTKVPEGATTIRLPSTCWSHSSVVLDLMKIRAVITGGMEGLEINQEEFIDMADKYTTILQHLTNRTVVNDLIMHEDPNKVAAMIKAHITEVTIALPELDDIQKEYRMLGCLVQRIKDTNHWSYIIDTVNTTGQWPRVLSLDGKFNQDEFIQLKRVIDRYKRWKLGDRIEIGMSLFKMTGDEVAYFLYKHEISNSIMEDQKIA